MNKEMAVIKEMKRYLKDNIQMSMMFESPWGRGVCETFEQCLNKLNRLLEMEDIQDEDDI